MTTTICGQGNDFEYRRSLTGIYKTWHIIELPDSMYDRLNDDLSDIRILSISETDTVEAAYELQRFDKKRIRREIDFEVLNQAKIEDSFYFTFRVPQELDLNEIKLSFGEDNFDWKVGLEGSLDQIKWFQVLENYRIVGIKNETTSYSFTDLHFPTSRYIYYRIKIESIVDPKFQKAVLFNTSHHEGISKDYSIREIQLKEESKTTIIDIELNNSVPISKVRLEPSVNFDFYRNIIIEYLVDSLETENGTFYNFSTLQSSTLSSVSPCEFEFDQTITNHLRLTIDNQDNEPVEFAFIRVSGRPFQLLSRFNSEGVYHLYYGNKTMGFPSYDISHFKQDDLNYLTGLSVGPEEKLASGVKGGSPYKLENNLWLWSVLVIIMIVLGYFSLKMFRD